MQIIILGDNEVAKGLTETLSREEHDVTLVGNDSDSLEQLEETFDIRTINVFPSDAARHGELQEKARSPR